MVARVGADVGTSAVWLIRAMIPRPADRPSIAVRMGIKVKSKMNTAAVRPTTSETGVDGLDTFCPR